MGLYAAYLTEFLMTSQRYIERKKKALIYIIIL
jgi:hypothetical protein